MNGSQRCWAPGAERTSSGGECEWPLASQHRRRQVAEQAYCALSALTSSDRLSPFNLARSSDLTEVWSLGSFRDPALPLASPYDWVRWRTLEVVGVIVLSGIALSVVWQLVSNDPKVVLLEGAVITAAFGVACSALPQLAATDDFLLCSGFQRRTSLREGAEMDDDFDAIQRSALFWRTVTIVWGVVNIAEALVRVVVVELLPRQQH